MKRRTLLKLLSFLPFAGSVITKALAKSACKATPVYRPYLPAGFPKWDRAIDGLEDASKWTLDFQKSLLPHDIQFPRPGQIWEAVRDCETSFRPLVSQPWPQTDAKGFLKGAPAIVATNPSLLFLSALIGRTARVRQGERIRILERADARPLHVTFQPLHYNELHPDIVPEEIRTMPGYLGYELSVKTAKTLADFGTDPCQTYFNEAFRLVGDSA